MTAQPSDHPEKTHMPPLFQHIFPENFFPSCHAATLAPLDDGSLIAAWYAGSREAAPDVAIYISVKAPDSPHWSTPRLLVNTPGKSEGNPVLFQDQTCTLWLFFVTMHGRGWDTCKVRFVKSRDGAQTWDEPQTLQEELGWMTRNKPIILSGGSVLLPLYDERDWSSMVLISEDTGASWHRYGHVRSEVGSIQPAVVELDDGKLLMLMRTGGKGGWMWRSESVDAGKTWSQPQLTDIRNPNSAADMIKLRSGRLCLLFNNSSTKRFPLTAALSEDAGRRWAFVRNIEHARGEFSYPALVQDDHDKIHAVYTDNRRTIKHVTFTEQWIMA